MYPAFPPEQAKALRDRFEFVYTPKHGSWLNMAEIELNVMVGQCLNRRIESIEAYRFEPGRLFVRYFLMMPDVGTVDLTQFRGSAAEAQGPERTSDR